MNARSTRRTIVSDGRCLTNRNRAETDAQQSLQKSQAALQHFRSFHLCNGAVESLKWLAVVAMVVDHVNAVFFARELGMVADAVGRVAMPIFALVLGYNLARPGADLLACLQRLVVFGLLSVPAHAYLFATFDGWWPLNIMATFATAVAVLVLWQRQSYELAGGLFLLGGFVVEYWWPGVYLVLTAYRFFRFPSWPAAAGVGSALGFLCLVNLNVWALLAVPLVALVAWWSPHVPRAGRFFWWFYPLHLAVLASLAALGV